MKISVRNFKTQKSIEYPCLMISKESTLVLFTSEKCGIVLYATANYHLIGSLSNSWHMPCFIPFEGEITLSN